jgi:hypothetical protein
LAANLRALTWLLVLLAVLELVDAPLIDAPGFAVAFAVLFVLAAWLIRGGRVLAGIVLSALLALFEVLGFNGWEKDGPADWTIAVATLVVSAGVLVLVGRHVRLRRSSPAAEGPTKPS